MKLGYSTWGMPEVPIEVAITHVARLGYDGIEITVLPRYTTALEQLDAPMRGRIRELLQTHSLELPAIAAHSSLLAIEPEQHRANMERLMGAVDLAIELMPESPPAINTTSGGKPEEFEQFKSLLVNRVGELVDYASGHDVTVALEPHVGSCIDSPARMLWLLKQINSDFLKVNFDDSHFAVQGIPISQTVPLLAPHTIHTHVKDFRGRAPDFEFLIPGEGEYDTAAYLRAMNEAGYEDFITVEVSIMVQRKPGYDSLAAAGQCYNALQSAFEEAGVQRT